MRQRITLGVLIHKVHGAANDNVGQCFAHLGFAAAFEFFEKQHHDVKKAQRASVDLGVLVHQGAAEQAFERAQQTPLVAGQIRLHGVFTEQHMVRLRIKKNGGRHFRTRSAQRDNAQDTAVVDDGGCRIRGAKVNAQSQHGSKIKEALSTVTPRPFFFQRLHPRTVRLYQGGGRLAHLARQCGF